jgi:ATP-dependent Clp protease adaptor protein ClpS
MECLKQHMQLLCHTSCGDPHCDLSDCDLSGEAVIMSSDDGDKNDGKKSINITIVAERPKTKRPPLYKVIMLNDDFTPMEFVVHVLKSYFRKSEEEATQVMLHVHQRGVGVCGVYTYEVAETKASQVMDLARKNQHPLQLQLEKE